MKDFIAVFFTCIAICIVFIFFFANLIITNIWGMIIFVAFLLSILITIFMNQESRIEELEKKIEQL